MKLFAELFNNLEQTRSTLEKVQLIKHYFETTPSQNAVWALYFLTGNKLKRLITANMLFTWCQELLSLPYWLMVESYSAVGDTAETIALLMSKRKKTSIPFSIPLSELIEKKILPLKGQSEEFVKSAIYALWNQLDADENLVLNKILTGTFRIGVSQALTIQGLSLALHISKEMLSLKLMGSWTPTVSFFEELKTKRIPQKTLNPYPFFLASPIQDPLETLGSIEEWDAEWKWDGIRAECIHRNREVAIWSRGNELITHQFPEVIEGMQSFPSGTVLDGEILAFMNGKPLLFGELQKRLGRKKVTAPMMNEVPVVFMVYDILEWEGKDIRDLPFSTRRKLVDECEGVHPAILISPRIPFQSWEELRNKREESRINRTEGLILKKKNSPYGVGRRRGSWWKFKIDPQTIDAILMYAQTGQGWRANLYTDYTFGVWHKNELVPIAKAYSGLNQEEIRELDKWIRKNTLEKFGPVRHVKPQHVFEIAFEGIQESKRHKSGVALRFPRIQRWRKDKPISECDSLKSIKEEFFEKG